MYWCASSRYTFELSVHKSVVNYLLESCELQFHTYYSHWGCACLVTQSCLVLHACMDVAHQALLSHWVTLKIGRRPPSHLFDTFVHEKAMCLEILGSAAYSQVWLLVKVAFRGVVLSKEVVPRFPPKHTLFCETLKLTVNNINAILIFFHVTCFASWFPFNLKNKRYSRWVITIMENLT